MTALAVDAGSVSAGPIGLLIVVLMGVATVALIRNMTGRIKRLPREFPPTPDDPASGERTDPPV